jgi:hypothetical protein
VKKLFLLFLSLAITSLVLFYIFNKEVGQKISGPPTESLGCLDLYEVLRTDKPRLVEEALYSIKARFPKFFDRYVAIFNSNSLQQASFSNPRILVFDSTARTVLTFNGQASQQGYESLELMCFDSLKNKFEFREIIFPAEVRNRERLEELPVNKREAPFFISAAGGIGGKKCQQCHQNPSRPNWDNYGFWPGVCHSHNLEKYWNRAEVIGQPCQDFFNKNWRGRYGVLNKKTRNLDHIFSLDFHLSQKNLQRIIGQLEEKSETIHKKKKQIARALLCQKAEDFKKESSLLKKRAHELYLINAENYKSRLDRLSQMFDKKNLQVVTSQSNRRYTEESLKAFKGLSIDSVSQNWALTTQTEAVVFAKLEALLSPLGLSIGNWSMSPGENYSLKSSIRGPMGGDYFPETLGVMFIKRFYSENTELLEIVQKIEKLDYQAAYNPNSVENNHPKSVSAQRLKTELCEKL